MGFFQGCLAYSMIPHPVGGKPPLSILVKQTVSVQCLFWCTVTVSRAVRVGRKGLMMRTTLRSSGYLTSVKQVWSLKSAQTGQHLKQAHGWRTTMCYRTTPDVFLRTEAAKLWVTPTRLVPSTSTIWSFTLILGTHTKKSISRQNNGWCRCFALWAESHRTSHR